jgi:hypothetical protein
MVFHHVDHHRRRRDAGHRPHRSVVVARLEAHLAPTLPALLASASAALPSKISAPMIAPRSGPDMRVPGDRRAGVKQQPLAHTGDHVAGGRHAAQDRARGHHAGDSGLVGFVDVDHVLLLVLNSSKFASFVSYR